MMRTRSIQGRRAFLRLTLFKLCVAVLGLCGCASDSGGNLEKLSCDDFLTAADLDALGLSGSVREEHLESDNPEVVAVCDTDMLLVFVLVGRIYDRIFTALEADRARLGFEWVEGPAVGIKSKWRRSGTREIVVFLSNNGHFAAEVIGPDQPTVEKTARAMLVHMDSH